MMRSKYRRARAPVVVAVRKESWPSSRRGATRSRRWRLRDLNLMISTQAHWQQQGRAYRRNNRDVRRSLGKIFSMELSQYGEDVDEIVVCADSASFLPFSGTSTLGRGVST